MSMKQALLYMCRRLSHFYQSTIVCFFFLCLMSLSGCSNTYLPGVVYASLTQPLTISSNIVGDKVGVVKCTSILGLVAYGDASINKAARMAGISKISHIDVKSYNILGIYNTKIYYVYGE